MSTFDTTLTPTPAAGKGIPYTWFTKLRDSIDAIKQGDQAFDQIVGAQQTSTSTGTQHNFALSAACATLLWTGTLDVTFTGFTGGVLGRRVRVIHGGTAGKFLRVSNLDAGSSAANKVSTPSIIGQYIGQYGVIELEWTGVVWLATVVHPGIPLDIAYAAGSFTAASGTWTLPSGAANLTQFQAVQVGQRLSIAISVSASTLTGGAITNLSLLLPLGASAAKSCNIGGVDIVNGGGTFITGIFVTVAPSSLAGLYRYDRTNLSASVANNYVSFDVTIPIL